jgi:hypothetical protein
MRLHIGAALLSAGAQLTAAIILFHGNPIVTASPGLRYTHGGQLDVIRYEAVTSRPARSVPVTLLVTDVRSCLSAARRAIYFDRGQRPGYSRQRLWSRYCFLVDFEFTQDTDRNAVPEPASWLLLATGLAATLTRRAAGRSTGNRRSQYQALRLATSRRI